MKTFTLLAFAAFANALRQTDAVDVSTSAAVEAAVDDNFDYSAMQTLAAERARGLMDKLLKLDEDGADAFEDTGVATPQLDIVPANLDEQPWVEK